MDSHKGFLKYGREDVRYRPVEERVKDHIEIDIPLPEDTLIHQATRCMDCGIPFCHGVGCPLNNLIPELHYCLKKHQWRKACEILHATNNFPEITGRVCPAPCEAACTLSINDEAVLIRHIEYQIAERGFAENWIKPMPAKDKTGRSVAIVGSGPAGLAAALHILDGNKESGEAIKGIGSLIIIYDANGRFIAQGIISKEYSLSCTEDNLQQFLKETLGRFGVDLGSGGTLQFMCSDYYIDIGF